MLVGEPFQTRRTSGLIGINCDYASFPHKVLYLLSVSGRFCFLRYLKTQEKPGTVFNGTPDNSYNLKCRQYFVKMMQGV